MYWQQHSWNRLPANHPQAINCSAPEGYVSYQIAGETTYETSFDAALGVFRRSGHHAPGTKGVKRGHPTTSAMPSASRRGGSNPRLKQRPHHPGTGTNRLPWDKCDWLKRLSSHRQSSISPKRRPAARQLASLPGADFQDLKASADVPLSDQPQYTKEIPASCNRPPRQLAP